METFQMFDFPNCNFSYLQFLKRPLLKLTFSQKANFQMHNFLSDNKKVQLTQILAFLYFLVKIKIKLKKTSNWKISILGFVLLSLSHFKSYLWNNAKWESYPWDNAKWKSYPWDNAKLESYRWDNAK